MLFISTMQLKISFIAVVPKWGDAPALGATS